MTIYTVTFSADNGLTVTVLAGEGSPQLGAGTSKWDNVDRPRRTSITRFAGKQLFTQDIPLRFVDLDAEDITSQEPNISKLVRMSQQSVDLGEPPKITLGGIAHRKDLTWVITDFTWGDAQWVTLGGVPVRVRADVTVHLQQYLDDSVLTTGTSPAVAAQTKKKKVQITVPEGMTLKQVAQLEYPSDPVKGMTLILEANRWLSADPRKIIPKGTKISIPDLRTGGQKTYVVP